MLSKALQDELVGSWKLEHGAKLRLLISADGRVTRTQLRANRPGKAERFKQTFMAGYIGSEPGGFVFFDYRKRSPVLIRHDEDGKISRLNIHGMTFVPIDH